MTSPNTPHITPEISAFLFDFNGTLSNDEDLLHSCYAESLIKLGYLPLGENEYQALLGRSEPEIAGTLVRARSSEDIKTKTEELIDEVAHCYQRECAKNPRVSVAAATMIKDLAKTHRLGVVTGTLRRLIDPVLQDLGISDCFQTVVTIEDVAEGKPAPEGFLLGASNLSVPAESVIVFEDSVAGVAAAHAAGMKVIAVGSAAGLPNYLEKIEDFMEQREITAF